MTLTISSNGKPDLGSVRKDLETKIDSFLLLEEAVPARKRWQVLKDLLETAKRYGEIWPESSYVRQFSQQVLGLKERAAKQLAAEEKKQHQTFDKAYDAYNNGAASREALDIAIQDLYETVNSRDGKLDGIPLAYHQLSQTRKQVYETLSKLSELKIGDEFNPDQAKTLLEHLGHLEKRLRDDAQNSGGWRKLLWWAKGTPKAFDINLDLEKIDLARKEYSVLRAKPLSALVNGTGLNIQLHPTVAYRPALPDYMDSLSYPGDARFMKLKGILKGKESATGDLLEILCAMGAAIEKMGPATGQSDVQFMMELRDAYRAHLMEGYWGNFINKRDDYHQAYEKVLARMSEYIGGFNG